MIYQHINDRSVGVQLSWEEAVLHARFVHGNLGHSPAVKANASPLTGAPCSPLRSFRKHWGPEVPKGSPKP